MSTTPKVSVIIPVYNVEDYLRQCLDSVINQTLKDIEIICVDDGSTDKSLEILHEYEKKDSRITVLTQKNQYAGVARNVGMSVATGKYFVFLDSDDFFEPELLELQFLQCESNNADIGLCAANLYNQSTGKFSNAPWLLEEKYIKEQPFNREILGDNLFKVTKFSPWTKIFSSKFIKEQQLQFQSLPRANDVYFVMSALALANTIVALNKVLVHYRVGFSTNLQSNNQLSPTAFCSALVACKKRLQKESIFDELAIGFINDAIAECLYTLNKLKNTPESYDYLVKELKVHYLEELGITNEYRALVDTALYDELATLISNADGEPIARQTPDVSVVIPVYNVQKYLKTCLDSIVNQTLVNIEILCVDDGSTDQSLSILKDYASKDKRICIISLQQNSGTLIARKKGVLQATGKYIMFVDSDDYLERTACRDAFDLIEQNGVDIVQVTCGVDNCSQDTESVRWLQNALTPKGLFLKNQEILREFFVTRSELTSLVGKIYSRDLCRKACLAVEDFHSYIGEDIFQFFYLAYFAKSYLGVKTNSLYWYRRGLGVSNNNMVSLEKFEHYCEMSKLCEKVKIFLDTQECLTDYFPYYKAMSMRMMEDCCRIFKNRVAANDQTVAAKMLLKYWIGNSVCVQTIEKNLGMSYNAFQKQYISIPDYVNIATAYTEKGDKPCISIIIPVYNTEEYLRECLESVVSQSFERIEIICVNDGSLDNSLKILEDYQQKDNRITVISKSNEGQSVARNVGLMYAHGEYVQFLDSDDMLSPGALLKLYQTASSQKLDVLFFNADTFYDSKELEREFKTFAEYYHTNSDFSTARTGQQLFADMERVKEYRVSPCLQLIKLDYLKTHKLLFPQGIVHEDNLFTLQSILLATSAARINEPYYCRRIRNGSVMTAPKSYSHFYGYLKCFIGMMVFSQSVVFENNYVEQSVKNILVSMEASVIRTFNALPANERTQQTTLTPLESYWFQIIGNVRSQSNQTTRVIINNGEAAAIRASWSYRIGRFITFIPRKIRGGIRCYQEHGMRYTLNRVQEKFWNLFGK